MRATILFIVSIAPIICFAQKQTLRGKVVDSDNTPLFAVNVHLQDMLETTTTNINGIFTLSLDEVFSEDTLVISFIGYEEKKIKLSEVELDKFLDITLNEKVTFLDETVIEGKNPITESFSVTKLNKMDIYMNPVSAGDPLKAITFMPSSTDTDENANPSLRGSSANRSIVTLNGVPVINPVRNRQISGIGNFSLFNTDIIDKQYVYASNPPLTYGNSTGGLVEIETINELKSNQIQVSSSLSNSGFLMSKKISKTAFFQAYGNYQFDKLFLNLNKNSFERLKNFSNTDIGLNFNKKINNNLSFNSFSYYIDEYYDMEVENFSYTDDSSAENKRGFTINNFVYTTKKGILSYNFGYDFGNSGYKYGVINSNNKNRKLYNSIDYKWFKLNNITLQFGSSHNYYRYNLKDTIPLFYFDFSPNAISYQKDTVLKNNNFEGYSFIKWDINNMFVFSSGLRTNIPVDDQKQYFSYQAGLRYYINNYHSVLISSGKYHNYTIPRFSFYENHLLDSYQFAADYSYKKNNTLISSAIYYKVSGKEQTNIQDQLFLMNEIDEIRNMGVELYFEQLLSQNLKFSFSNTFLNQKFIINNEKHTGTKSLKYFIKTSLNYNNPKYFNLALTYNTRPGLYYSEISNSKYNCDFDIYMPVYDNINNKQHGNYNNISLNINRFLKLNRSSIIVFASINNLLNSKNERTRIYNQEYSFKKYEYYQKRTIYFGVVWRRDT